MSSASYPIDESRGVLRLFSPPCAWQGDDYRRVLHDGQGLAVAVVVGVPDGERYGVRSHVVVRASSRHSFQRMVEVNDRVAVRIGLKR